MSKNVESSTSATDSSGAAVSEVHHLLGQTVAISGAGNGLGRSYALATAAAGANVIVADLDAQAATAVADEVIAAGGQAVALAIDVTAPGAGEHIAEVAHTRFGGLDGFVANAAILQPGALLEQSEETVHRSIALNVESVINTVTAAARTISPGGSIVVIVSGSLLGSHRLALYGTTKAATLGLIYGLAVELEGSGVRITGLAPHAHTTMSDEMGGTPEEKGGTTERIAPIVVYLLSDKSRELNGQVFRFDGARLGVIRAPFIDYQTPPDTWNVDSIAATIASATP